MKKTSLIIGCICAGCVTLANPGYTSAAESADRALSDTVMADNIQEGSTSESAASESIITENVIPENEDKTTVTHIPDEQTPTAQSENIRPNAVLDGWIEESDGMHYYIAGTESINQGLRIEGKWYYFDENGVSMRNRFRQKGEDIYYYDANGWLVTATELDINGAHYKFQASGAAFKGWDATSSGRYYYTDRWQPCRRQRVKN